MCLNEWLLEMSKEEAVKYVLKWFDDGYFEEQLAERIAMPTESQKNERKETLVKYICQNVGPALEKIGFTYKIVEHPSIPEQPFMIAQYIENPELPTILLYGHGDVVNGDASDWEEGLQPFLLTKKGDHWYGRGTADNKGQHTVNMSALEAVFKIRGGHLGFNCTWLLEMGEEVGSPALGKICEEHSSSLSADILFASDGPRVDATRPTLFLGNRGLVNFSMTLAPRLSYYHSGNWGGILMNPAIRLASAISSIVDKQGALLIDGLKPSSLTPAVREALQDIPVGGNLGDPLLDPNWGEPGLTQAEKLYGWNTLEVLSLASGNPELPGHAIPGSAKAVCQLRFVVGTKWTEVMSILRAYLDRKGFDDVKLELLQSYPATRLDPSNKLVDWTLSTIAEATGKKPALLPNFGGGVPNYHFTDILNLPTLWIPHSYPSCGQHGANEHNLKTIYYEGLKIMTELFWKLGDEGSTLICR